MQVLYERCCGLDVHAKSVVACLITPDHAEGKEIKTIKTFGTMTEDLLALADWLTQEGCTHVAIESTGVYWKPVFNILEGLMEVILVNAQHIKKVPGRKTDVSDAEWIAQLLQHGLLQASFIPPQDIRQLRDWTRYRKSLIQKRGEQANRIQKLLESCNIKLGQVATDVLGVSGRAILKAIVAGEDDPEKLADLAKGRLKNKSHELKAALKGRITPSQRRLLAEQLLLLQEVEASIERCNQEIGEQIAPFFNEAEIIDQIPGIDKRVAEVVIAEIGVDMNRFPTANHLASWAGICPGNNESGGKRKSGKTNGGNPWLKAALIEAAWAASRCKNSYLAAQYGRLVVRKGKKKALVAVAHSILIIIWHMLAKKTSYKD
jgi:transposase